MKVKILNFYQNHMILSIELIVFLCCLVICACFPSLWKDIVKVMVLMFTPLSILDIATNAYLKRKTAHKQE